MKPCEVSFKIEQVDKANFKINENQKATFTTDYSYTVGSGTNNYEKLYNKPQINDITLIGNKTSEELGLEPTISDITEQDIDEMIYGG